MAKEKQSTTIKKAKSSRGGVRKNAGRPKGVPNKVTADMKIAIMEAFNNSGGVKYLEKVAQEDMRTFCGLLGKVLPLTVSGDPDAPVFPSTIRVKLVDPAG